MRYTRHLLALVAAVGLFLFETGCARSRCSCLVPFCQGPESCQECYNGVLDYSDPEALYAYDFVPP